MSQSIRLALGVVLLFSGGVGADTTLEEERQIRAVRESSNEAMRARNRNAVLSTLTNDVLITTGNGTLIVGKPALRAYLETTPSDLYFVRTPREIAINPDLRLAWEAGVWRGFDAQSDKEAVVGGRYSAMWTKASGEWLIKSQLFVTLDE